MQQFRSAPRAFLLGISLLSACAAARPSASRVASPPTTGAASGVFGEFLVGRFAISAADPQTAATQFLRALAARPDDQDVLQQAFIACLIAGRSEAVQMAHQLPGSQGRAVAAG